MNTINYNFFETYKKLEKICNEIYSSTNGITQYINEMKSIPSSIYQYIPNWKSDLSTLHTLRHIRNQMAHNEDSFNQNLCTLNDIEWLINFHTRIMEQTDPLSLLRQRTTSEKSKYPITKTAVQAELTKTTSSKSSIKNIFTVLLLTIIITVFCLIFGWIITTRLFQL